MNNWYGPVSIQVSAPKPENMVVRTHPQNHDTHSLHERKCEVRTPFLTGAYPIFLSCKRALRYYLKRRRRLLLVGSGGMPPSQEIFKSGSSEMPFPVF